MKVLDLFSGIGGFSVGLERAGFETVAFCEIEEYPRSVLKKHWPDVPVYGDIKQLTATQLRADGIVPELICGGFPCQPFSVAGRQRGKQDERHLLPEMLRLIRECKPRWVIGENVTGLIKLGLDEVLTSLEAEGYTTWSFIIPAVAVNAPHQRDRLWIIAHADGEREPDGSQHEQRLAVGNTRRRRLEGVNGRGHGQEPEDGCSQSSGETVSDADNPRGGASQHGAERKGSPDQQGWQEHSLAEFSGRSADISDASASRLQGDVRQGQTGAQGEPEGYFTQRGWWEFEPAICRVANGVRHRSHRIKGLGNAVIPAIPEIIGRTILRFEASNGK